MKTEAEIKTMRDDLLKEIDGLVQTHNGKGTQIKMLQQEQKQIKSLLDQNTGEANGYSRLLGEEEKSDNGTAAVESSAEATKEEEAPAQKK